jgi:hypothetical protein
MMIDDGPDRELAAQRPAWTPLAIAPIATAEDYVACAETLQAIKAYQRRVVAFFGPHKRRLDEAKRALLDDERKALAPAATAEAACKTVMIAWDAEQQRIREAEEARLREAARIQEEARILEDAARLELEARRTGNVDLLDEATQLIETPVETPAIFLERTTPKVAGISYREVWSARVVNLAKLIAWVARHPDCVNYLAANLPALNAAARAQRDRLAVDGVEAVRQRVAASSTGGR